jgi:hypothetical protein
MADDDVQHAPWPAGGLPLAEAFWLIIDRQVSRDEATREFGQLSERGEIHLRFIDAIVNGHYRGRGRRGSLTAVLSDIPASEWPYFALLGMSQSRLLKHGTDIVWYDVRIWPASPTPPGRRPGRQSPKDAMCEAAKAILNEDGQRPPKGKGRLSAIVDMIHPVYGDYQKSTISRYIGQTVREWEQENQDR